jgi:hypothetical protein
MSPGGIRAAGASNYHLRGGDLESEAVGLVCLAHSRLGVSGCCPVPALLVPNRGSWGQVLSRDCGSSRLPPWQDRYV